MKNNLIKVKADEDSTLIGAGFSNDSQQLVENNRCYSTTVSGISSVESVIALNEAMVFEEFVKALNLDFSYGSINLFKTGGESDFYRTVMDDYLSMSFNYYQTTLQEVLLQVNGMGEEILTDEGKTLYNNGNNIYFGIECGDNFISSYKEGAMLLMSIKLAFYTHQEKLSFEASSGNIGVFSEDIQEWAQKTKAAGKISIIAYQKGGIPSELANILDKSSEGDYYSISCSLQDMDACVDTANSMLDYAYSDFSTQFSVDGTNSQNITVLGDGQYEYTPTYRYDLPVESIVTPAIIHERVKMSEILDENQNYYKPLSDSLLKTYPVEWSTSSENYAAAKSLNDDVKNNVDVILDPVNGEIQCFYVPESCLKTGAVIQKNINPVTESNLSFLEDIKYYFLSEQWGAFVWDGDEWESTSDQIYQMDPCYTNQTSSEIPYLTEWGFFYKDISGDSWHYYSNGEPEVHEGSDPLYEISDYCRDGYSHECSTTTITTYISEWYFTTYNQTMFGSDVVA
ncbi:MAG: hypothetical protein N4A31_03300 [Rickettsiales bacterium]|jgi:hypothetical protein|nr:hypothetical protein [Rickettsiales bacterium]